MFSSAMNRQQIINFEFEFKSKNTFFLQFGRLLAEQCYIYCNFLKCYKSQCFTTFFVAILNERHNAQRSKGEKGALKIISSD